MKDGGNYDSDDKKLVGYVLVALISVKQEKFICPSM
jgi:hypothetical protein